jgi:hypothetical protein
MTDINDAVKKAIEDANPGLKLDPAPQPPEPILVPQPVAANICKMLERVQVTGMESVAWVQAFQIMQQIANQGSSGVPFNGLGK